MTLSDLRIAFRLAKRPEFFCSFVKNRIRAMTQRDYKADGMANPPSVVLLTLTLRCNLNCYFCYQKEESKQSHQILSLDTYQKLIDEIAVFHPVIQITGGEPFLYKEIIPLLQYIKHKKLVCMVNTNGTLLDKYIDDIIEMKLDKIAVSIDGPKEIHEHIRGKTHCFDKTIQNMKHLTQEIKKRKIHYPITNVISVMNAANMSYLEEIVKIFSDLDADFLSFFHLWFNVPETVLNHRQTVDKRIVAIEGNPLDDIHNLPVEELIRNIYSLKRQYSGQPILFFPDLTEEDIRTYYGHPEKFIKRTKCYYPWLFARISCNGSVVPCPEDMSIRYSFGNIQKQSFQEIWNNDRARFFRSELVRHNGVFPVCSRCCSLFKA